MAAIIKFDQSGLPAGTNNRSREDIVAGTLVTITNVSPGTSNALVLLWKPPEDDTAVIAGSSPTWNIVPKTGIWGTYRFRLTVDGVVSEHTFDVKSPVLSLPELAPNEKADPTASLIKNTSTEIDASETNEAFLIFTSGSAWGWWYKIRRWLRKLDDLFHATTGHTHDGTNGNGPTITTGTPPHASTTGQTVNDHHNQVHAIGGGDHSGTMTLAELNAFISDATLVDKDTPNIWTRKQTFTPTEAEEAIEATGGTDKAGIKTTGGGTTGDGIQSYGAGKSATDEGVENTEGMGAVSVGGLFGLWSEGATDSGVAVVAWGIQSAIGLVSQGGKATTASGDDGGIAIEAVGGQGDGAGAGGKGLSIFGANGGATGAGAIGASINGGDAIGGNADGGDALETSGGTGNGSGQDGLGLVATPDAKIKTYSQASEPTLLEDEAMAFWENTGDSNKIYLIFRRGAADQVKIQLT